MLMTLTLVVCLVIGNDTDPPLHLLEEMAVN